MLNIPFEPRTMQRLYGEKPPGVFSQPNFRVAEVVRLQTAGAKTESHDIGYDWIPNSQP